MKYFLAIDIGASSGRHILGSVQNGKIVLEEIYRFENKLIERDCHKCWDVAYLRENVVKGIAQCKILGKLPETVGIDTWAVDFVLLDKNDKIIGNSVAYRDDRTNGMKEKVDKIIPFDALYKTTGIQYQKFNTIYQLCALNSEDKQAFCNAKSFLMIPDYLNFCLCGVKANEYTNATSTALVNAQTKTWDRELIEKLNIPFDIFQPLKMPKTVLGDLSDEIQKQVGFNCKVILPCTHDTGSAFLSVPARDDNCAYISSGTWSLLGVENEEPVTTVESMNENFTNEGGMDYRFRFLKNIMGLWMLQSLKRELGNDYSFNRIENEAKENSDFNSIVDVNDNSFLAPKSMAKAVKDYCKNSGQAVPKTVGQIARCIYISLAFCYKNAIENLSKITDKEYSAINIVGGGSKDGYLNQLTSDFTKLPVYAGPTEGTALGNIIAQCIYANEFSSLASARKSIRNSFEIKEYKPNE